MALKKRYISPYTTIAAFAHVKRRKSLLVIRTWYDLFRFKEIKNETFPKYTAFDCFLAKKRGYFPLFALKMSSLASWLKERAIFRLYCTCLRLGLPQD